jgi:hypothetical protein
MENTVNTLRNTTRPLNKMGSTGSLVFKVLLLIAGVVLLYYLYQALFTTGRKQSTIVIPNIVSANAGENGEGSFSVVAKNFPRIMEGGEYSVSFWMYVNNWTYRTNQYKHVLSIGSDGGDTGFNTLVVYLGAATNSLHVRVQSRDVGASATSETPDLTNANINTLMNGVRTGAGPMDSPAPCDIPTVELQRWVLVTVVLNNKTCDVYLDGKLARSCILPGFYRVPNGAYSLKAYQNGGFGGFMSQTTAYGYALNPEDVWKLYMAGPTGTVSFLSWLQSFFKPDDLESQFYPKMN